jgi:DNA-binding transcriptional MerR regulator
MRASTLANLLNQQKAAKLMGVRPETLRRWARKNDGPPRIKIGKRYYYTRAIIVQWLAARSLAS